MFGNYDTRGENKNVIKLNCPLDPQEVHGAIHKLKSGKTHGCDTILADTLKLAGNTAVQFLAKLFNIVFDEGASPEEWSKAIIILLFKKGNKNITDNYGGISRLSLIGKCTHQY